MDPIHFFAQGIPKGQPRPRAFARKFGDKWQARVYTPGSAEEWKSQVALAAKPFVNHMIIGEPVGISTLFVFPRPKSHFKSNGEAKGSAPYWHIIKPDGDNLYKGTVDALVTIGLLSDDSIIAKSDVQKRYSGGSQDLPGCVISIWTMQP